ncbi:uncharacterized protein [Panulirus ornatus]|uniref:uncharacterized protein n=1 Tax=Panulirus ornatus TaxID=150431 RepID=UPI003A8BB55B
MNLFVYDDEELVVLQPKHTYGGRRKLARAPPAQAEKMTMVKGGSLEEKGSINSDNCQLQQGGRNRPPQKEKNWIQKQRWETNKEELDCSSVSEYEFRIQQNIIERKKLMENLGILKIKEDLKNLQPHQTRHSSKHHDIDLTRIRRSQRLKEKTGGGL